MPVLNRWLVRSAGPCLVVLVLGCGKTGQPTGPGGETAEAEGGPPASSGKEVFDRHCAKCHSVGGAAGGPGPKGRKGGPDLSKTGADPAHTPEWVAALVRDPQAHAPGSKMPSFTGKLTDDEIRMVSEYVAGLK